MILDFFILIANAIVSFLVKILPSTVFGLDLAVLSQFGAGLGVEISKFSFMFPVKLGILFVIIIIQLELAIALFGFAKWLAQFIRGSG